MLKSKILSKVRRPPIDRYLFFHPANCLSSFSKIGVQIEDGFYLSKKKKKKMRMVYRKLPMPYQDIGKIPTLQPKKSARTSTLSTLPTGTISHSLWTFMLQAFGIHWVMLGSVAGLLSCWHQWLGKHNSDIWNLVSGCLMWIVVGTKSSFL